MAIREIVTWPDPVLKQKCTDVLQFDAELHTLLDDMAETMATSDGIGLAANQVAVPLRIFVMDVPVGDPDEPRSQCLADGRQATRTGRIEIINPRIVAARGETRYEEGCLSFPGVHEFVNRSAEIDVEFQDRVGVRMRLTARGLVAICMQHELDHLDGITFLDRLSPLKRRIAMRDYLRENRELIEDAQFKAKARSRRSSSQAAS